MAEVIGPGASKHKCDVKTGKSMGPGGPGGGGYDMTTKRGYEAKRTTGLRTNYQESASANNSKAGR